MPAQIELDELHRFTTDEYHRLGEAGAFEDFPRLELIDGLLVRKDMKSREHEQAIEWLSRYLAGGRVVVQRGPRGDGYEQVIEVQTGGRIVAPAALPELSVGELLGAAAA
jgi:hypothetical protein